MNNLKTVIMKKMTKKHSIIAAVFIIAVIITDLIISQFLNDWISSLLTSFIVVMSLTWVVHIMYFCVSTAIRLNSKKLKPIPECNEGKIKLLKSLKDFWEKHGFIGSLAHLIVFGGLLTFSLWLISSLVIEIFSAKTEDVAKILLNIWVTIVGIWSYIWPYIEPGIIPIILVLFAWFTLRAAAYEGAMMAIRDSKLLDEEDVDSYD